MLDQRSQRFSAISQKLADPIAIYNTQPPTYLLLQNWINLQILLPLSQSQTTTTLQLHIATQLDCFKINNRYITLPINITPESMPSSTNILQASPPSTNTMLHTDHHTTPPHQVVLTHTQSSPKHKRHRKISQCVWLTSCHTEVSCHRHPAELWTVPPPAWLSPFP